MEAIMHIIGTCGDAPAHLDLLDILLMSSVVPFGVYLKYKWHTIKSYTNAKFRKRTNSSGR
jgi:hypothetical protein